MKLTEMLAGAWVLASLLCLALAPFVVIALVVVHLWGCR